MIWRDINIYLIDITRYHNNENQTDEILSETSYDARKKIIDYINDFMYANNNEYVSPKKLDSYLSKLGEKEFNLKDFMTNHYNKEMANNLKINQINDYELGDSILKMIIENDVIIYHIKTEKQILASEFASYIINDSLIMYLDKHNRLNEYEKLKVQKDALIYENINIEQLEFQLYNYKLNKFEINQNIKI